MRTVIGVVALCALAACSGGPGKSSAPSPTPKREVVIDVKSLLSQESEANSACRGGSGGDATTENACKKRDQLNQQLADAGWCWGLPTDRSGADAYWHTCAMSGTASMPARLKATAEVCKSAFLRDQTYPDAYTFAAVTRYRFVQTNPRDIAKQLGSGEPQNEQEAIRFAEKLAKVPVLTVVLPFTNQPFGGEQRSGTLTCEFASAIGGEAGALNLVGYPQESAAP